MTVRHSLRKAGLTLLVTGAATFGLYGTSMLTLPSEPAYAATQNDSAVKLLNSFYKPALQGIFPSSNGNPVDEFVIGETTRASIIQTYGKPSESRKTASGFDVYHAEMGTPGYAISYQSNVMKEIRYLGTQVERNKGIGSITMHVLKKNWYAPNATETITSAGTKQTKLTYNRGDYKLEFIYNSPTDLDHINLSKK